MNEQQRAVDTILNFLAKLPLWGWLILLVALVIFFLILITKKFGGND